MSLPCLKAVNGSPMLSGRINTNSLPPKYLSGPLHPIPHPTLYGPETPKCLVSLVCMFPSACWPALPHWPGIPAPRFPPCEPLFSSQAPCRHCTCGKHLGFPGWAPQPSTYLPVHDWERIGRCPVSMCGVAEGVWTLEGRG